MRAGGHNLHGRRAIMRGRSVTGGGAVFTRHVLQHHAPVRLRRLRRLSSANQDRAHAGDRAARPAVYLASASSRPAPGALGPAARLQPGHHARALLLPVGNRWGSAMTLNDVRSVTRGMTWLLSVCFLLLPNATSAVTPRKRRVGSMITVRSASRVQGTASRSESATLVRFWRIEPRLRRPEWANAPVPSSTLHHQASALD